VKARSVLIVDDDFDIRDSLKDILEDEGYQVAMAADGEEALEYLRRHPAPGVILLDWMMPRCDGAHFRARQTAEPELASIPVILLTADVHAADKTKAIEANDFLAKPVKLAKLLEVVGKYCSSEE
jgi:CheY-like chemotaxis protein